jgi:hypothetical protein
MRRALALSLLVAVGAVAACGFDGLGVSADDAAGSDASTDGAAASETSSADGSSLGDGGPGLLDASTDAPSDAPVDSDALEFPYVYGHTVTDLYRLEPISKTWAHVGPLTGCANMADIAVDRAGNIVGVGDALYAIDPATGACSTLAPGPQPFTLTFVPKGTVDPVAEALVAYVSSSYYRVNRTTGALTQISPAVLAPYAPSGDVVSVEGGGTYVSVTGPACADCLLEVNPTDGSIVKNLGAIGLSQVFGLGSWAGKVYAFLGDGTTYELTLGPSSVTGATLVPNPIKPPSWIGGGSSTHAPK